MERYFISYDFEDEGSEPEVMICDRRSSFGGTQIVHVDRYLAH